MMGTHPHVAGSPHPDPLVLDPIMMLCIHEPKTVGNDSNGYADWRSLFDPIRELIGMNFMERAKEAKCLVIVSMGLLVVHDVLAAPIPAAVIAQLETPPIG